MNCQYVLQFVQDGIRFYVNMKPTGPLCVYPLHKKYLPTYNFNKSLYMVVYKLARPLRLSLEHRPDTDGVWAKDGQIFLTRAEDVVIPLEWDIPNMSRMIVLPYVQPLTDSNPVGFWTMREDRHLVMSIIHTCMNDDTTTPVRVAREMNKTLEYREIWMQVVENIRPWNEKQKRLHPE